MDACGRLADGIRGAKGAASRRRWFGLAHAGAACQDGGRRDGAREVALEDEENEFVSSREGRHWVHRHSFRYRGAAETYEHAYDLTDPRQLQDIFWSSGRRAARGRSYDLDRLAALIDKGAVRATPVRVPRLAPPDGTDRYAEATFAWAGRGSGGSRHQHLKWSAWHWAAERYAEAGVFESGSGRPKDLVLPSSGIWIECGDTNPRFAFHDLLDAGGRKGPRAWNAFVVVGFKRDPVPAWIFDIPDTSHPVIEAWRTWRADLRQIFREFDEDWCGPRKPRPDARLVRKFAKALREARPAEDLSLTFDWPLAELSFGEPPLPVEQASALGHLLIAPAGRMDDPPPTGTDE